MNASNSIYRKIVITLVIVLAIIILVFFPRQPSEPKKGYNQYTIGVFSHIERMNTSYIYTGELARTDINNYCRANR